MPRSRPGINIALSALEAPSRQIAENREPKTRSWSARSARTNLRTHTFDAQTEQHVDKRAAGIVDPAKAALVALQDATSVPGLIHPTRPWSRRLRRRRRLRQRRAAIWAAWTIDRLRQRARGRRYAVSEPPYAGAGADA